MKVLICKIFGHKTKTVITQRVSLKRYHMYCPRCNERIRTNIKFW
jgi:hypothetical protein